MNVIELRDELKLWPAGARVCIDVAGIVRDIDFMLLLHDGAEIVLIVPKEY